jgi:hypothetical protein
MASYVHTHEITKRLRVVGEMEIGDGSVQQNVITSVVVICRCEDSDNPDLGVASTDPWVSLESQLAARVNAPREEPAPWSG